MKLITQTELLSLIEKNQIDVSNFPARRISHRQVVVEVFNKNRFDVLTAPEGYEKDGIVDTLLTSFTLSDYCERLCSYEKSTRNNAVRNFFQYIQVNLANPENQGNAVNIKRKLPIYCVQKWFDQLRENDADSSSWRKMASIKRTLAYTLPKLFGKTNKWPVEQKKIYEEFKALTPRTPKSLKTPPLGRYLGIPASKFTNRELLMGLRYGVIWMLQKLQAHRAMFLSQPPVVNIFDYIQGHTKSELSAVCSIWQRPIFSRTRNESQFSAFQKIHTPCWKVIVDDPLLREWQCYRWIEFRKQIKSINQPQQKPISVELQLEVLSGFFDANGDITSKFRIGKIRDSEEWRLLKKNFPNKYIPLLIPCMWGSAWFLHTEIEQLLMTWLLATERTQRAGITNLRLDNVHISHTTPQTLQISTVKLRRTSNTKKIIAGVESNIYRKYDPPFQVYKTWLDREILLTQHLKNFNLTRKFLHGSLHKTTGLICTTSSKTIASSLLPFELISVQGTVWQETFLKETPETALREAYAFIEIIRNRVQKKIDDPNNHLSLPISIIGQSLVVEQQRNTNKISSISSVESETLGHKEITGKTIYKAGFYNIGIEEIIEPVMAFARRVGDEKIKLANEIAERINQSQRKISLNELEKICGIETSLECQNSLLRQLDEQDKLTISGEIMNGSEVLIVETELTACLMWGYIKHIEANIESVLLSSRDLRSVHYIAKLINLHHVFAGFPQSLQNAGKLLFDTMDLPFPPLE